MYSLHTLLLSTTLNQFDTAEDATVKDDLKTLGWLPGSQISHAIKLNRTAEFLIGRPKLADKISTRALLTLSFHAHQDECILSKPISAFVSPMKVADPKVLKVSIEDNGEPCIDLLSLNNPRIKHMQELDQRFKPSHNQSGFVRKSVHDALLKMLSHLPENIGIAIYEGLRPLTTQRKYFQKKLKEIRKSEPDETKARAKTSALVSPPDITPVHCTGAAIDLTLFSMREHFLLDLGKFGVIFGPNDHASTFSDEVSTIQKVNRVLLLRAALLSNLVNYGREWWHYSLKDRVWAIAKGEKRASYGIPSLDEKKPRRQ